MRTVLAGLRSLRRTPRAILPLTLEGLAAGVLVAVGATPAGAGGVTAGAAFPLDVFFDLKQAIGFAPGWPWFLGAMLFGVLVRGGVLAGTLWLSDGSPGSPVFAWARAFGLGGVAAVALFPVAGLMYVGTATRYAPFLWVAAPFGFLGAALLARRALRLDVGSGQLGRGVPEITGFLAYVYIVAIFGAVSSVLEGVSVLLSALFIACLGPIHGLFLLGWREHLREGTYPGAGTLAAAATVLASLLLIGAIFNDRVLSNPAPRRGSSPGTLLLLGGADSSSASGPMAELDPRDIGFMRGRAQLLSYRGMGERYDADDTRADLEAIAEVVSAQVAAVPGRRLSLLGHSQASLILDRLLASGSVDLSAVVVLAPPPPRPPPVSIPSPNQNGRGRVGGDIARAFAAAMDALGMRPFDVDAPASPTNLESVVVTRSPVRRLAVWALTDSAWLAGDWRRPGEINIVGLTDHVGVTRNSRVLDQSAQFFSGDPIEDDEASWRGLFVSVIRYVFEPWRPG